MQYVIFNEKETTVDVAFRDGMIAWDVPKGDILKGRVRRPSHPEPKPFHRIGWEKKHAISKEKMIILNYRKAVDIDVLFPDGGVVTHTTYAQFKNGRVPLRKKYYATGP